MKMKTNGIDLAKNVFQVHGIDDGHAVLRKGVSTPLEPMALPV